MFDNNYRTFFQKGIKRHRDRICYEENYKRFLDLEPGELIDMKLLDDIQFFHFLHPEFVKSYLNRETYNLYSLKEYYV